MQPPDCLKHWLVTSPTSFKHPRREYHVSFAIVPRGTVWDAWAGSTSFTKVAEQVAGGLGSAAEAVAACRKHSEGRV